MSSNAHDVYRSPKRLDVSPLLTLNHRMVWGTTEGQADALETGWGWDVGCFCVFVCVCVVWSEFLNGETTEFSSFDTSSVLHYHWFFWKILSGIDSGASPLLMEEIWLTTWDVEKRVDHGINY